MDFSKYRLISYQVHIVAGHKKVTEEKISS